MDFLFNPCESTKVATIENPKLTEPEFAEPDKPNRNPATTACGTKHRQQRSVIRTYDHEVKGNTTLKPLQGEYAGPNDAAVLKPLDDSLKGLVFRAE